MDVRIKLWSFLHAFQQSPYKYLYMSSLLEALDTITTHDRDALFEVLATRFSDHIWWTQLVPAADKIEESERRHYDEHYRFVFYGEALFPPALAQMSDPPLALSYQGDLAYITGNTISVVGSREPLDVSSEWMQSELYTFLKKHRVCVISGGARGVDQKAHFISILLNIPTAVVLPTGLTHKYPAVWEQDRWRQEGVVFVSELPLGARISKHHFSSRNRLIAAWGLGTLIVEARLKSGTLMTAHHALAEGRDVWVVPGHPHMPSFAGSLQLITEQAEIVRNASDLSNKYV